MATSAPSQQIPPAFLEPPFQVIKPSSHRHLFVIFATYDPTLEHKLDVFELHSQELQP